MFDSPSPEPGRSALRVGHIATAVSDPELELARDSSRADLEDSALFRARDAVSQRVLDERLQQHHRHGRREQLLIDRPLHDEAVAEAHLLDLEIRAQEL